MDLTKLDLVKINDKLKAINYLGAVVSESYENDSYGEMTSTTKVYHLYDKLYIAVTRDSSSYGDRDINGVQFVIPTKRTFTDFEPVR